MTPDLPHDSDGRLAAVVDAALELAVACTGAGVYGLEAQYGKRAASNGQVACAAIPRLAAALAAIEADLADFQPEPLLDLMARHYQEDH
jgi:hypothetical protein